MRGRLCWRGWRGWQLREMPKTACTQQSLSLVGEIPVSMKSYAPLFAFAFLAFFSTRCASGYQNINPKIISYQSKSASNEILLEYKYDLLHKKYKAKESKHKVRLIAIKLTNLSDKDLIFGKDLKLITENGDPIRLLERDQVYKETKQIAATYLLYLALTPLQFTITRKTNGVITSSESIPVGFVVGPGLAARNMIVASSSNKRYKKELKEHYLLGRSLKKGETTYGLIGIRSSNYDAINFIPAASGE
jgi:hypothetical protein